jgi:Spy/CpxP family protein refolding chaperone
MASSAASMKQVTGIAAIVLLGAGAALGCGGGAASSPPPQTASGPTADEQEATEGLVEHHRHHHHGGVTLLIAMSLDTLGVSPEQKAAVEKIRADLHARMQPAHAAEQSLVNTLADGVAQGTIDPAKVDSAVAQLTAAAGALHDASTDALNQLHAVLTPPQRAALVDKLEAHWTVWQKANSEEEDHVAHLASELGLTADQVQTIRGNLAASAKGPRLDPQEVTAHIQAFGQAFRAPTFDAKTLTTGGTATAHMVGWGATQMARFVQAVSPVLTPDQRARFAQTLHEHGSHNPSANGGG